ncbi:MULTISPECIES: helix-turn-helix domain-containing protein [Streptomyces]|uniref:helix-turn-helix domain-containing protein n=1 Tax=Streptomyces TaxID=1883 RepID=UPI000FFEE8AB|nr:MULTISPECIES: helix-turn-helix domain-containing protein [Streptomyces]WUD08949.1 helix-turn-helix transcriptional regulator [Streptomyces murinus]
MDREALRSLLRHKRSLIDPSELGWPLRTGRGRRSAGLSQAQVAHALYVSERTYAQLERGDMPSPAPEFLDAVSTVLRMAEPERGALYVYALGHEPPVPMNPEAGTRVDPAWFTAVQGVSGVPCYVNDVAWNLLAWNDDFLRMFPRVEGAEPELPERNVMRWMLLREEAREHHLLDWAERWAAPVAAQLRAAVAAHPDNPDLRQLDAEVNDDPVVGPIYRRHDITYVQQDGDTRPVRHAGLAAEESERCCEKHTPSARGLVTLCAAQPLGSPGARFFFLVFRPLTG